LTAARQTGEDGGHVLAELQSAVERPVGNHFGARAGALDAVTGVALLGFGSKLAVDNK